MSKRPFLTAAWYDLVMMTWAVDQQLLTSLLPRGIELDLWRGDALASVVAFRFEKVRVRGVAIPWHTHFPEVNLRFYVKRQAPDGSWRRGVVFVQERVPRFAIAWVARTLYGEPYVATPMRDANVRGVRSSDGTPQRTLRYEWKRDAEWEGVVAVANGEPRQMLAGSVEEFIAEHYWGYTARGPRSTREYQVEHPRWNVTPLAECSLEADVAGLYGPSWVAPLSEHPVSTFLADGSTVAVYPGRDVEGTALASKS